MQAVRRLAQNDNLAPWRRRLSDARRAILATLTPDEIAEASADRERRREEGKIKREAKRKSRVDLGAMVIAGDTLEEIAAKTGLTVAALWHRRLYWGLPIAVKKGFRRLFAWIPDDAVSALDELAADMGIDRQRVHEALLKAAFADEAFIARRTLGVRRRAAAG